MRKKADHLNLEKKRNRFFFTGLLVACAITLTALEWTTFFDISRQLPGEEVANIYEEEEEMVITVRKEKAPKPQPKKVNKGVTIAEKRPVVTTVKEVENSTSGLPEIDALGLGEVGFAPEVVRQKRDPFVPVEKMPSFPGGETELFRYFAENVNYPAIPKEEGIEGTVFVAFIVQKNGKLANIQVARGVHPYLDQEALRVVQKMPDWIPGEQMGKKVVVGLRIPIKFTLKKE